MGWGQEAYEAECAAIARALHEAAFRDHTLGKVTIFADAQAAIWRMTSDDPGPGRKYAIIAIKHIATLRAKAPKVKIGIRLCPSHQGIDGNEVADEWAKLAADDRTPMEWSVSASLTHAARSGRDASASQSPWPTSNAVSRKRNRRMRKTG